MRKLIYILALLSISVAMSAQTDRKEVRSGNRQFRRENYKEAEISYRKALVKDSLSFAANYNLANVLYRGEHYDEAGKILETVREAAPASEYGADYFFNAGDIALAKKDYAAAVDAFKQSLLLNPGDLQAKENYIYARKMLENRQQNGGGQDNQQNQDDQQNQDNQDNQDNHQDRNDNQQNQDQQNNQDQQDSQDGRNGQQPQPVKISPQQAQQMLKAMQAKEKETQDKVNREKAEALKSRQKEKNW
ncbi:MAG: tetratricopeptide repeat protein [Candidatus Cryptobacteroides sp.]|nr:tetratricopeptide repeat protein [Bacteroidales bacterium]MDY5570060.1 tetratricopeptide repeat protein [Candidatus Cryptobacteroides sp.]